MTEGRDDEGLGAEIANRDGGTVVFGERTLGVIVEDFLGEESGTLDGEEGDVDFMAVGGHGAWMRPGGMERTEIEIWKGRGQDLFYEKSQAGLWGGNQGQD